MMEKRELMEMMMVEMWSWCWKTVVSENGIISNKTIGIVCMLVFCLTADKNV